MGPLVDLRLISSRKLKRHGIECGSCGGANGGVVVVVTAGGVVVTGGAAHKELFALPACGRKPLAGNGIRQKAQRRVMMEA